MTGVKFILFIFLAVVLLTLADHKRMIGDISKDLREIEDSLDHLERLHPGATTGISRLPVKKPQPKPKPVHKKKIVKTTPVVFKRVIKKAPKKRPVPKRRPAPKKHVRTPKRKPAPKPKVHKKKLRTWSTKTWRSLTGKKWTPPIDEIVTKLKSVGEKIENDVFKNADGSEKSLFAQFTGVAAQLNAGTNTKLAIDGTTDAQFTPSPISQAKFDKIKQITALAFATYCEPANVEKFECFHCKKFTGKILKLKRIQDDEDYNAAIVGETPLYNFLIFRGSRTRTNSAKHVMVGLENWITNFEIKLVHLKGFSPSVKVHSGMYDAYNSLRAEAFEFISTLPKHKPLYVGGHSRGGAIATIAAMDAKGMGYNVELMTLGSPRVGNKAFVIEFAKSIGNHSIRVVNKGDFIPHTPLVKQGFFHVPNEIWIDSKGKQNMCRVAKSKPWAQDPNCSVSVPLTKFNVEDHGDYLGFSSRGGEVHYC